jgi:hypothetical protein
MFHQYVELKVMGIIGRLAYCTAAVNAYGNCLLSSGNAECSIFDGATSSRDAMLVG